MRFVEWMFCGSWLRSRQASQAYMFSRFASAPLFQGVGVSSVLVSVDEVEPCLHCRIAIRLQRLKAIADSELTHLHLQLSGSFWPLGRGCGSSCALQIWEWPNGHHAAMVACRHSLAPPAAEKNMIYIYIHVRIKQQTLPITSKINRLWDWLNKVPLPASLVRAQPKAWVTASPNQDFLSGLWDRERSVSVSVIVAKSKQSDTKDWLETPVSQLVNVNATQHYWEAYCFLFCRKRMELQMNFIQDQICKCSILQIRPGHHF